MDWLVLIVDSISALAVIVSILYLAMQIRENSRFARASIYQSTTEMMASFVKMMGQDGDLNRLYFAGLI